MSAPVVGFTASDPAPGKQSRDNREAESPPAPAIDLDESVFSPDGRLRKFTRADLSTPRGSVRSLLMAGDAGEFEAAGESLLLPAETGRFDMAEKVRKLSYVLRNRFDLPRDVLPDSPVGLTETEAEAGRAPRTDILLANVQVEDTEIPVRLERIDRGNEKRWVFSQDTVDGIDKLYRNTGIGRLSTFLPFHVVTASVLDIPVFQLAAIVGGVAGCWLLAGTIRRLLLGTADRVLQAKRIEKEKLLGRFLSRSVFATVFFSLLTMVSFIMIGLPTAWRAQFDSFVFLGIVSSITWFLIQSLALVSYILGAARIRDLSDFDILRARSFDTQLTVLRRALNSIIFLIGLGVGLSAFEWFSSIGASLLASAGVFSIIVGIGAQRTLANVFAGIQVALTQPFRIGDMVVFRGEWGYIEAINYTYVVIRIWDFRRMVVPITTLLDEPVMNFSQRDPRLYAKVYLYLDYTAPITAIRDKLEEIAANDENHDGDVASVLVTDSNTDSLEVRAVISARDGLSAWYLSCNVREQLIEFLRDHEGGRHLPRARVTIERDAETRGRGSPGEMRKASSGRTSEEERKGVGEWSDGDAAGSS